LREQGESATLANAADKMKDSENNHAQDPTLASAANQATTADVSSSPLWADSLDAEIQEAQWQVRVLANGMAGIDGSLTSIRSQVDALKEDLFDESL
jgi:hypothetical protein